MEVQQIKETKNDHSVHELIKNRWSPRAFDGTRVVKDEVMQLLEAVRWAPSANNEQPWRFIVAEKGTKAYEQLEESLMPGNKLWAPKAPLFILTVARTTFSKNGKENGVALYDLGQAVANLSLQATDLGLHLHQMGGFNKTEAHEAFSLAADEQPVTIIAVGYQGDADELPDHLKERELAPRARKPISEFTETFFLQ